MSRGMWMLFILIGFAMGGIMNGRILPQKLAHTDVCALSPDHNPGAANVFTYCGWKMGLLCLALDMGKGFLPVFTACQLSGGDLTDPMIAPLMLAPVLGHALAPFSRKKGGKAIACAFGVLLGLLPGSAAVFVLAFLYILFSTLVKINPHRRRSIVTFSLFGLIALTGSFFKARFPVGLGCVLISAVVVIKHLPRFDQEPAEEQEKLHSTL